MPQTSVTAEPTKAFPGLLVGDHHHRIIATRVDEAGGIEPGLCVMRSTAGDSAARLPPAFLADDDAIILAHATAAAPLVLDDAAELDGVIGEGRIYPPAKLELVLSAHVDFDASSWPLVYEDEHGVRKTYNFPVPDGGNATLRTPDFVSRVISLTQPTQAGVGGSFKLGTTLERAIGKRDALGISVHTHKALFAPSSSDNEKYENEAQMPVVRKDGLVRVKVENAFNAGDSVFVRCTAAGVEKRGAIRVVDDDAGDCACWTEARLVTSGGAGEFGVLEVDI